MGGWGEGGKVGGWGEGGKWVRVVREVGWGGVRLVRGKGGKGCLNVLFYLTLPITITLTLTLTHTLTSTITPITLMITLMITLAVTVPTP